MNIVIQNRTRPVELLRRQLALEEELAGLAEDAYGLTREERNLLHATRPIRDPVDILKARISGRGIAAPKEVSTAED